MPPWSSFVGACLSCRTEWKQIRRRLGPWLLFFSSRWEDVLCGKRFAAIMELIQRFPRGEWEGGCTSHLRGPQWNIALLAMPRVQQKWVSAFDSEILAPLHISLWCQGLFVERRHFYGLYSNLYDFPLEARGWEIGEEQNPTKPLKPKPQEPQVKQIACSQKPKWNQPENSFFRQ